MVHVAVLLKPYLDLILSGKKTVECRLTKQARDPYKNIEPGQRIYFKQSSGPYEAIATADHVLFEDGLTRNRIKEIQRDYNELICGEEKFWNWKRDSNYCTLIWLTDVRAIDTGPRTRPLQGVAWLTLDEEPAWRVPRKRLENNLHEQSSFFVEVTPGNVRNNTLYVSKVLREFPKWSLGGNTKASAARRFILDLHDGPTVETDIVASRKLLRTRIWGSWFRKHKVKPGDLVVFTPVDNATYTVGLTRRR